MDDLASALIQSLMKFLYSMKQCVDAFKDKISFMHPGDRAGKGVNECKIGDLVWFSVSCFRWGKDTHCAWSLISVRIYDSPDI